MSHGKPCYAQLGECPRKSVPPCLQVVRSHIRQAYTYTLWIETSYVPDPENSDGPRPFPKSMIDVIWILSPDSGVLAHLDLALYNSCPDPRQDPKSRSPNFGL